MRALTTASVRKRVNHITNVNARSRSFDFLDNEPDIYSIADLKRRRIVRRQDIPCSICGKQMHVIFYDGKRYRGGHYFGKIPLHRKSELEKMRRSGTHKSKNTPTWTVGVYNNYDSKPYAHVEYWECPECYWHPKMA